jgi:RNA polymerase sigma factor (sigma-70 family)
MQTRTTHGPGELRGSDGDLLCLGMGDTELVASAIAGDTNAFAAIYDRYVDRIYDYSRSVLRSDADAADVTQDTFLAASERLHQLRDPERLRSWLYAIARNSALRIVRERKRTQVSSEIDDVVEMNTSDGEIDARELVWAAAAGLAASDRDILDLHLRQGLDGQELADALGVAPNVANVALHRVRTRLEQSVGAVLLAKTSKQECPELDGLMADGLNPLARKRIARHVESCSICDERRRVMTSPAVLFAATPLALAPLLLRDQILQSVGTARAAGAAAKVGWRQDGFPEPEPIAVGGGLRNGIRMTSSGFNRAAIAASAAVVILAVVGFFLTPRNETLDSLESLSAVEIVAVPVATEGSGQDDLVGEPRIATPGSTAPATSSTAVIAAAPLSTDAPQVGQEAGPAPAPDRTSPPAASTQTSPVPPPLTPSSTAPATTAPEVSTTVVETVPDTVPETVPVPPPPPPPPVISLVQFVCGFTMQVTVDITPSTSINGQFQTTGGLSTPLTAHPTIAGRFIADLDVGEGSFSPLVAATGLGGSTTLPLANCIVIG